MDEEGMGRNIMQVFDGEQCMKKYDLISGYTAGVIGQVTSLQAQYYSENWAFEKHFEIKVATELSAFMSEYDEDSDCIFSLLVDGKIEGSISVDGAKNSAHVRWFIVSDKLRGQGCGRYLMNQAINFCEEKGYCDIYLWTFKGLDSAKYLYEEFGFRLSEERVGDQWGTRVVEQRYEINTTLKN